MAARDTRGVDSDGNGSLTPSERSENDDRSELDSDYESDDEEDHDRLIQKGKTLNVHWTGYGRRVPVILFNAECVLNKSSENKEVGERYHLSFKFASAECKIVRNILLAHGFHEVHPNSADYNLVWSNSHLKPFTLRTMSEFQKINHFPRSYELTRKDRLFKNIQRMQQIKGHKHFDFVPPSYVLPGDYQEFCSNFLKDKGPYIVKPVASSRGRGVFLVNHPDQVPLDENLIVSKYIASPLVIDGFKFDIRIYVAVTSYDPVVIYLYEEGITRFATVKYERNIKHMRNQCMHLTNYSVNKKSQDYVKNDDPDVEDYGNKWTMGAMLRYLRSEGKDTAALMMRIEDVVIKTILSVESSVATACKMFQPYRGNCFELYGFDVLLDEQLKPWVLEVNLSPSLACDSPLDLKIKSNMLCDLFSLSGVICHDPMMRTTQTSKRNQEVISKLGGRAKDVEVEDVMDNVHTEAVRVNMKKLDAWLYKKARPQTANSIKDPAANKSMAGLTSEEIKIVRRIKEEEVRKRGWIRIFPTADSWDTHGSFLQFHTSHNLMLHQRLYPERHKGVLVGKSTSSTPTVPPRNSLHLQGSTTGKADQEKYIESYTQALLRARQYERRLGSSKSRARKKKRPKAHPKKKLSQGVVETEDPENVSEDEQQIAERGKDKKEVQVTVAPETKVIAEKKEEKEKEQVPVAKEALEDGVNTQKEPEAFVEKKENEKSEPNLLSALPNQTSQTPESKYDVVLLLERGQTLSKVQARTAFAMYLIRVQQRLLSDCGSVLKQDDIDALNEQMDLVLRFLKRAAINLPQAFRVVVPSKKLPLSDRRRILAKQLGDFVHMYNKETDHLKAMRVRAKLENKRLKRSESMDGLDDGKFDKFVYTAAEGELEEVLTTYTKINKSAAIFLGGEAKTSSSSLPDSKREILSRRRENPDITDGTIPIEDARSRQGFNNNNCIENFRKVVTVRPASAAANRQTSSQHSYVTSDPVVDTYNEKAIQEALQRLAVKQHVRQYSSMNGINVLKPELTSRPPSGRKDNLMSVTGHSQVLHSPSPVPSYSRNNVLVTGPRYMTLDEHMRLASTRPSASPPQNEQHVPRFGQPESATIYSFIEDPNPQWQTEIANAYNEVTGVSPHNYHVTSVNSRQYQIAHQQAIKQKMMEQSKAMLEHSKAKHKTVVTQAQNLQGSIPSVYVDSRSATPEVELQHRAPKPPTQPSTKKQNNHRVTRKPSDENLAFNFYTNMQPKYSSN